MSTHLVGKLDEIIEDLIRLKFYLIDSRPALGGENASTVPQNAPQGKIYEPSGCGFRMECANGHHEWEAGTIISCDDSVNGPFFCPDCGEVLWYRDTKSEILESIVKGEL